MAGLLTPEVTKKICGLIQAGAYPHIAAIAAGIHKRTFYLWMSRKEPEYLEFQAAVEEAKSKARVIAENWVFKHKPLDWLKAGPGRTRPGDPGWTDAVAVTGGDGGPVTMAGEVEVDYKRLSTEQLEKLDALERERDQLLAQALKSETD